MRSSTARQQDRRASRILVLLETHDSPYESLTPDRSFSGTPAGFAEPFRILYTCGVCLGEGCAVCVKGRVEIYRRDRYDTGNRSYTESTTPVVMPAYELERALERLQAQARERAGIEAPLQWYVILRRAASRDASGSYAALRRALERRPVGMTRQATIAYLVDVMPEVVRIPRWAYLRELDGLRAEVEQLRKEGMTVSELAAEFGVSRRRIRGFLRSEVAV